MDVFEVMHRALLLAADVETEGQEGLDEARFFVYDALEIVDKWLEDGGCDHCRWCDVCGEWGDPCEIADHQPDPCTHEPQADQVN